MDVASEAMEAEAPFGSVAGAGADVGQIGISVEPVASLQTQTPHTQAAALTASDLTTFTTKMLESFHSFATSFASPREQAMRQTDQQWIPLGSLHRWHANFQRKLGADPLFWRK